MPLVWGTVLLSNVFSRAATPNSFRSRSSKADSARHRGTNYVIKDQQLQEIGWPKEPTCRGAFALYLSVCTALLSVLCNSLAEVSWAAFQFRFFLPDPISLGLKALLIVMLKKKKQQIFDEITEVPISLPQTALSSPSSICNSTSLWMSGSGFCFVPTLLKSRLERKTSRREHFKIISEVQRWEKIKKGYECPRVLHLPERTSSLISIKIVSSHSCPLISIIIFNKLMRSPQKCWIKKKNRWPKKVYLPKRNDSPLLTLLFSFSLQPLSHIL